MTRRDGDVTDVPRALPVRTPQAALARNRQYWSWRRPDEPEPPGHPSEPLPGQRFTEPLAGTASEPAPAPPTSVLPTPATPFSGKVRAEVGATCVVDVAPSTRPPADGVGPAAGHRTPRLSSDAQGDRRWNSQLSGLAGLPGTESVAAFDASTSAVLFERGEPAGQVVDAFLDWAGHRAAVSVARGRPLEDVIVTTSSAHHLLRLAAAPVGRPVWVYVRLRRPRGNLGITQRHLADLGRDLESATGGPTAIQPVPRPTSGAALSADVPAASRAVSTPAAAETAPVRFGSAPAHLPGAATGASVGVPEPRRPSRPESRPAEHLLPAAPPRPSATALGVPRLPATVSLTPSSRTRSVTGPWDRPDDPSAESRGAPPPGRATPDGPSPDNDRLTTTASAGRLSRCLSALREFVSGPHDDPGTHPRRSPHEPTTSSPA